MPTSPAAQKSVFHGASPARQCGGAGSSPLDGAGTAASSQRNDLVKNYRVHPTHWLISTQAARAGPKGTPLAIARKTGLSALVALLAEHPSGRCSSADDRQRAGAGGAAVR